jgi:hypothetical protein
MNLRSTNRGFGLLTHPTRANEPQEERLIQESSAIGDYENSFDVPGSSYLWIGADHHLDREEVAGLIRHMQRWLDTGRLVYAPVEAEFPEE